MITFGDFKKVEITVGKILSAEKVPETDKLLKLSVDFGLSPLVKGVPNSDSGRDVNNPRSEDGAPPLVRGITPALADSGTSVAEHPPKVAPFSKGDGDNTTTPQIPSLEKEGRQDTSLNPPSEEGGKETPPQRDIRQIISGIAMHFPDPQTLVGRKCMFVTNLEPRTIKGLESNGMLFVVSTDQPAEASAQAGEGKFSLLEPNAEIPEGTRAK